LRILNSDLLIAQTAGYPVGGFQPAVSCLFDTANTANTATYDYSFDPTGTASRLKYVEEREHASGDDSAVIMLSNYDRAVASNLIGYYVDLGFGLNTSAGVKSSSADGATVPRQWVMSQSEISGAPKGQQPQLYSVIKTQGVWGAILSQQQLRLGFSPFYRDEDGLLAGKTIYGCLEYLCETTLTNQTGIAFTLDALGTQDDGHINTDIPFPLVAASAVLNDVAYHIKVIGDTAFTALGATSAGADELIRGTGYRIRTSGTTLFTEVGAADNNPETFFYATGNGEGDGTVYATDFVANTAGASAGTTTGILIGPSFRSFNQDTPSTFETYGSYFKRILEPTSCVIVPRANLAFRIVYAQTSDAVTKTYYSSYGTGHPFYSAENQRVNSTNHIEILGGLDSNGTVPTSSGHWYDPDQYSGTAYIGNFMPVTMTKWEQYINGSAACNVRASALGLQLKDQLTASRVVIPMDVAAELYDRITVQDQRGH
jgi:hypothetical protein